MSMDALLLRVRLPDAHAPTEEVLEQYDRLPVESRAELPLKRIWTVASRDEEDHQPWVGFG